MPTITINHDEMDPGVKIDVQKGVSLYEVLTKMTVELNAPCGGRCYCGKCKIRVVSEEKDAVNTPLPAELDLLTETELAANYRLACAVNVNGNITVLPDGAASALIMLDGEPQTVCDIDPVVKLLSVNAKMPDLNDQRGDIERVAYELASVLDGNPILFTPDALRELPVALRSIPGEFGADFVVARECGHALILASKSSKQSIGSYGVAVDVGTTTIVCYLMDLVSGVQIDVCSALSPQRVFGADVVSRTDYANQSSDGLLRLQQVVRSEIEAMINHMAARQNIDVDSIYHVVCVGNTVMMHLLGGIDPKNIAVSPFIPVYNDTLTFMASELGFGLPRARVTLGPCVSGYVGADTIAAIMASGMDESGDISLLIDIGTNGEIALGGSECMLTCSTAAGPAFEGAHIRCGTGGVVGAINRVALSGGSLSISTIGDTDATGICGSGLVDAVAIMKAINAMDETGRITPENAAEAFAANFTTVDGKPAFWLSGESDSQVVVCQRDLREVQLAKAAIAAGIAVLMNEMKITHNEIKTVFLAGGFGNYIDVDNACRIGLLPMTLRGKIRGIGNGAGAGAKKILLSRATMKKASALRKHVRYLELSSRSDFQDLFVENMMFE